MKNIYISGPMRGYPEFNFPAFFKAEEQLHELLDSPVIFNPARKDVEAGLDVHGTTGDHAELPDFDLRVTLSIDLQWVCELADAIVVLDGWERSKGAKAEVAAGLAIGVPILKLVKGNGGLQLVTCHPVWNIGYLPEELGSWPFPEEMGEPSHPTEDPAQGRLEDHLGTIHVGGDR